MVGDVVGVDGGLPAGLPDLLDHLLGRRLVLPGSVQRHSEVVHDHLGAFPSEQAGHAGPDPPAGPRHDRDPAFEQVSHDPPPCEVRPVRKVGLGV